MVHTTIGSLWTAWNASWLHAGISLFNWHRWRIHSNGICAIKELYSPYIDKNTLVNIWAYDTLDALKRASYGRFCQLGMRHGCMLVRIY